MSATILIGLFSVILLAVAVFDCATGDQRHTNRAARAAGILKKEG
jgi:hypothetical protein